MFESSGTSAAASHESFNSRAEFMPALTMGRVQTACRFSPVVVQFKIMPLTSSILQLLAAIGWLVHFKFVCLSNRQRFAAFR